MYGVIAGLMSCMSAASLLDGVASASTPTLPSKLPTAKANPFRIGRPLIIPHGGGDGFYPENTMAAWRNSMDAGGDVVDIDVFMTGDGVLIAFHDDTLERTTNGHGRVTDKPYADIAKLDAGFQFRRNGKHPFRGKNVRVPTIESVLKAFPNRLVTLDLKDQRTEVALPVCVLLQKLKRTDVYVGVDTTEQVESFRKNCPEIQTSGTDEDRRKARAARDSGDRSFVSTQLVSQPSYIGRDGNKRITAEFLAFAHRYNTAVLTWVVDDPKDMEELIDLGIDGIYTRRPDLMRKILLKKKLLK
jgi:glycerophosphoryl diester phosphodiesterase